MNWAKFSAGYSNNAVEGQKSDTETQIIIIISARYLWFTHFFINILNFGWQEPESKAGKLPPCSFSDVTAFLMLQLFWCYNTIVFSRVPTPHLSNKFPLNIFHQLGFYRPARLMIYLTSLFTRMGWIYESKSTLSWKWSLCFIVIIIWLSREYQNFNINKSFTLPSQAVFIIKQLSTVIAHWPVRRVHVGVFEVPNLLK